MKLNFCIIFLILFASFTIKAETPEFNKYLNSLDIGECFLRKDSFFEYVFKVVDKKAHLVLYTGVNLITNRKTPLLYSPNYLKVSPTACWREL